MEQMGKRSLLAWFSLAALLAVVNGQDVLHTRSYFYVGGRYVNVTTPNYGTGPVLTEQIYVEKLEPLTTTHPYPLIFWTGLGQSGTNWLDTPDKRPGWASYFLSQNYTVYLCDQPIRGRSPYLPSPYADNDAQTVLGVVPSTYAWQFWTGTQHVNAPLWPQAKLHTQWPGTGLPGSPAFDSFVAALVPSLLNQTLSESLSGKALASLIRKTGPAILITHSQGGPHGWVAADAVPNLLKGIVAIEPQGPPFVNEVIKSSGPGIVRPYGITQTPITYSPALSSPSDLKNVTIPAGRGTPGSSSPCLLQLAPPRKLSKISKVPVMIVTSEAGYHAVYDTCTVQYLRQAGVNVSWVNLPGRD